MTALTSHPYIPLEIRERILNFFNEASTVEDIIDGTIVDDPNDGPGYKMGQILAKRILETRSTMPGGVYTTFDQIDCIKGVGINTISDLVYSFSMETYEDFKQYGNSTGMIYAENWPLEYFRYIIGPSQNFESIANDQDNLIQFVVEKFRELCSKRNVDVIIRENMISDLKKTDINHVDFETWLTFGDCDVSNWLSTGEIIEQTTYAFNPRANQLMTPMKFLFLNLNNAVDSGARIGPKGLPVAINQREQSVTFWTTAVFDKFRTQSRFARK